MGVEYFDCELCGQSTNDCCSSSVYVNGPGGAYNQSYGVCEGCMEDFENQTGAKKIYPDDKYCKEYVATLSYYQWVISRSEKMISKHQHIIGLIKERIDNKEYNEKNDSDEESDEEKDEKSNDSDEESEEEEAEKSNESNDAEKSNQ
jgi:hypothetical protein